jgi:hypothetical protein
MIRSDRPILEGPLKPTVIIRQFLHPIAQPRRVRVRISRCLRIGNASIPDETRAMKINRWLFDAPFRIELQTHVML